MSYIKIKESFKQFLNVFDKKDLDKVFDYVKSTVHEYEQNPLKFTEFMLNKPNSEISIDDSI